MNDISGKCKHGISRLRPCGECMAEGMAEGIDKLSSSPACYVALPKLTDEMEAQFIHTDLLELDENANWQWTQIAVDFACCLDIVKAT